MAGQPLPALEFDCVFIAFSRWHRCQHILRCAEIFSQRNRLHSSTTRLICDDTLRRIWRGPHHGLCPSNHIGSPCHRRNILYRCSYYSSSSELVRRVEGWGGPQSSIGSLGCMPSYGLGLSQPARRATARSTTSRRIRPALAALLVFGVSFIGWFRWGWFSRAHGHRRSSFTALRANSISISCIINGTFTMRAKTQKVSNFAPVVSDFIL